MIEPNVTAVLGRRLLAFLIDVSLVVATGLGFAIRKAESFAVVGRDANNDPLVDPAEFDTIRELLDFDFLGQSELLGVPVARLQEVGDTVYVFGSAAYRNGFVAAAIAAVVVFGVVPAFLQRTIGMLPFGIGIRSTDGSRAGIGAHLSRTVVGFVDAVPFVIPGLLGFAVAKSSQLRQRLGDRVANTAVVDLEAHRLAEIPDESINLRLESPASVDLDSVDAAPDLVDAHTSDAVGDLDAAEQHLAAASADTSASSHASPIENLASAEASAGNAVDPATAVGATQTGTDSAEAATAESASAEQAAGAAETPQPATAHAGSETPSRFNELPPPPVHRKSASERPLGTLSDSADPAQSPDPGQTDQDSAGTDADAADNEIGIAAEIEAPTATAERHLAAQGSLPLDLTRDGADVAVPDDSWQPPKEEVAPVWQPTRLEPAPKEAPSPRDGRTLDDVSVIEPSIGALLADNPTESASASQSTGSHGTPNSSAKTPVWSDKWRAWMYWDSKKKYWLRHDTESNTWVPVD